MINNKLNKLKWMFAATALTAGLCATEGNNAGDATTKAPENNNEVGKKEKSIDLSNYIPYLGVEGKVFSTESLDVFLGGRSVLNGSFGGVYGSLHSLHNYLLENLNFFGTVFVGTELSKQYKEKFGGGFLIGATYRINDIFAVDIAPGLLFQKGESSKIIINVAGSYVYDNKYRVLVGVSPKFNFPCFSKSEDAKAETKTETKA